MRRNAGESYRFAVGALECVAIADGTEPTPVASVVKDVSADALGQALADCGLSPTDDAFYFNCLYVQTGERKVLFDAGWGHGTQRRDGALIDRLLAEGVQPTDVDTVVITHGDADHVGGIAASDGRLTFPNAEYVLLKDAWEFWTNAPLVAKWPPFLTAFAREALPLIRERVRVVASEVEFLPGFRLISVPGHRPGHCAVEIAASGERLIHLADAVGHLVFLERPAWRCAFDAAPDQAVAARLSLLRRASDDGAIVFGPHLPFPGVGRLEPRGDGWRWRPLEGASSSASTT